MSLTDMLVTQRSLFIKQKVNWTEVLVDFETRNRYAILTEDNTVIGMIAERSNGLWGAIKRMIMRSHRAFIADVVNVDSTPFMTLSRDFFFFFSDLFLKDSHGNRLGSVHRRFGLIFKKYDLRDASGQLFATIKSPLWRLWTFPVTDLRGASSAVITKRWGGALKEIFTDADTYKVDFGTHGFTESERKVILGAAVSIDFDFFEENQGRSGAATDLI